MTFKALIEKIYKEAEVKGFTREQVDAAEVPYIDWDDSHEPNVHCYRSQLPTDDPKQLRMRVH